MLKGAQWIGIRNPPTSMKSSSHLLQLKRAVQKQQRPSAAKNNFFLKMTHSLRILLFSHSVMSGSLRPHGLQHARLPCPSLSPKACSHSCPLTWWCHPTISSSVKPFSFCHQSFPASGSFPMRQFFTSSGQNTGTSTSASLLPIMNIFRVDFL